MKLLITTILLITSAVSSFSIMAEEEKQCPAFLNGDFKRLHSSENLNLCELYKGKPMLLVNTASHCGFTKQFKPLEALYQKYKDEGFQIIGFASDDFNQEAKSEEEAAGICFKNYGVTFTMLAPTKVKGAKANSVFNHLAKVSGEQPSWNFNKYLVSANGSNITHYGSRVNPLDSDLEKAIAELLR